MWLWFLYEIPLAGFHCSWGKETSYLPSNHVWLLPASPALWPYSFGSCTLARPIFLFILCTTVLSLQAFCTPVCFAWNAVTLVLSSWFLYTFRFQFKISCPWWNSPLIFTDLIWVFMSYVFIVPYAFSSFAYYC